MAKKIIWSPNASQEFWELLAYLEREWSFEVANNFSLLTEQKIKLLAQFPHLGSSTVYKQSRRKITVTKRCILIYEIEEN